jgi:MFS family permease
MSILSIKKKQSILSFTVELMILMSFSILYTFFRMSIFDIIKMTGASANNGVLCVSIFGICYALSQLIASGFGNIPIKKIIVRSSFLVAFYNILMLISNNIFILILSKALCAFGFVFNCSAILSHISGFIKERELPSYYFSIISGLTVGVCVQSGFFIASFINSNQSYSVRNITLLISLVATIIGLLSQFVIKTKTNDNIVKEKKSLVAEIKGCIGVVIKDRTFFIMMLFSMMSCISYYIFVETGFYSSVLALASGVISKSNKIDFATSLLGKGFSIGLILVGVFQWILRGPVNLLIFIYGLLSVIGFYIFISLGHVSFVILNIFSFLVGFSSAVQFATFSIIDTECTKKSLSVASFISFFNFLCMFVPSMVQLFTVFIFSLLNIQDKGMAVFKIGLIPLVLSLLFLIIHRINLKKTN